MKNSEPLPIEEIRRRITSRLGIEEDELKVLYPTEERLREFYEKEVVTLKVVDNAEDDWPEDNFKLAESHKDELKDGQRRRKDLKDSAQAVKKSVRDEREKLVREDEFLPAEQSHLPPKERVSLKDMADAANSLKDLNLDDED